MSFPHLSDNKKIIFNVQFSETGPSPFPAWENIYVVHLCLLFCLAHPARSYFLVKCLMFDHFWPLTVI